MIESTKLLSDKLVLDYVSPNKKTSERALFCGKIIIIVGGKYSCRHTTVAVAFGSAFERFIRHAQIVADSLYRVFRYSRSGGACDDLCGAGRPNKDLCSGRAIINDRGGSFILVIIIF